MHGLHLTCHCPPALQAKHRSRFFSLADVFLASGMVPAYTAAAFVKRLARLALTAPPAGALLALAFAHNIVRRHPATMQLLHRPPRGGLTAATAVPAAAPQPQILLPLPPEVAASQPQQPQHQQPAANGSGVSAAAAAGAAVDGKQQQKGPAWQGLDVFEFLEPDPGKSRALESSLWELEALRQHYNPQVRGGQGRAAGGGVWQGGCRLLLLLSGVAGLLKKRVPNAPLLPLPHPRCSHNPTPCITHPAVLPGWPAAGGCLLRSP
jgi:hypothetical protein